MNQLLVKKSGEQQPQQIVRDGRDDALGRQVFAVQMIDAARLGVGRDELVREMRDGFHEAKTNTKARRHKDFVGNAWPRKVAVSIFRRTNAGSRLVEFYWAGMARR